MPSRSLGHAGALPAGTWAANSSIIYRSWAPGKSPVQPGRGPLAKRTLAAVAGSPRPKHWLCPEAIHTQSESSPRICCSASDPGSGQPLVCHRHQAPSPWESPGRSLLSCSPSASWMPLALSWSCSLTSLAECPAKDQAPPHGPMPGRALPAPPGFQRTHAGTATGWQTRGPGPFHRKGLLGRAQPSRPSPCCSRKLRPEQPSRNSTPRGDHQLRSGARGPPAPSSHRGRPGSWLRWELTGMDRGTQGHGR